jgi:hypothetical protein
MSRVETTGYLHRDYAESLSAVGAPWELPRCGGWILERSIPGFPHRDAMGCYPLFTCKDWSQLHRDLDDMENDLVSISLVADPFSPCTVDYLQRCFKDRFIPFKEHMIIDLSQRPERFVSSHHRRYARKALRDVTVERCNDPMVIAQEWTTLYATLIERHGITGISAFSASSLRQQLVVPGIEAFRATLEGTIIGMLLWYVQGDVSYYHLGAYSEKGYEFRASFALFSFSIEYFASIGLQWLNLGAGAGLKNDDTDGLSRFKRGWSTGSRTAYFCGRILDPIAYAEVMKKEIAYSKDYFPAYRKGEFD